MQVVKIGFLYLLGHKIAVVETTEDSDFGRYDKNTATIYVFAGLTASIKVSTILHEALEAGVEIQVGDQWEKHGEADKLELITRLHESAVFALHRDKRNRWFVEQLTDG